MREEWVQVLAEVQEKEKELGDLIHQFLVSDSHNEVCFYLAHYIRNSIPSAIFHYSMEENRIPTRFDVSDARRRSMMLRLMFLAGYDSSSIYMDDGRVRPFFTDDWYGRRSFGNNDCTGEVLRLVSDGNSISATIVVCTEDDDSDVDPEFSVRKINYPALLEEKLTVKKMNDSFGKWLQSTFEPAMIHVKAFMKKGKDAKEREEQVRKERQEAKDKEEYERLKKKFEGSGS